MFTQKAAVINKMAVTCITTQMIVYYHMDGPWSVSQSGTKSSLHMWSLAYGSRLKNGALGSGVCIYIYPGGTPSVLELWVLSLSSGEAGGVPGLGGPSRGGGAPVSFLWQRVSVLFAVPFWQGRQLYVWFSRTIAGCLAIPSFTLFCPGNTTSRIFSSQTSECGLMIIVCISSIAPRENRSSAILAIFRARRMSDYSSCTRPPCLAIVADMLKTYRKLVAASRVRIGCYLNHRWRHSVL